MGRYFLFRMHPWSVAEAVATNVPTTLARKPQPIGEADWQALLEHGGFPEPFITRDKRFTRVGGPAGLTSFPRRIFVRLRALKN